MFHHSEDLHLIINFIKFFIILLDPYILTQNCCKSHQLKDDLILIFQFLLLMKNNTIILQYFISQALYIFKLNYCKYLQPK